MRNKYERFYTLLGCQDNVDCLKYLIMFKLIAPASSNLFSLKPANHPFISCIFLFSLRLSHSVLKSTSTAQAQLPVIYVSIFQKLVKFCYKIKQPAPHPQLLFFIPSGWHHTKKVRFSIVLLYGLTSCFCNIAVALF